MLATLVRSPRPLISQTCLRLNRLHTSIFFRNAEPATEVLKTGIADASSTTTTINNTVERKPSAAPKGTVLKGLQYLKDKPEPVALDDSEYPDWLWDLLDEKKQQQKSNKPTNRQYHRKKNREAIKASNFMKSRKT